MCMVALGKAWGETLTEFDPSILEARGIDPKVAEHFRTEPRFEAGRSRVMLLVNGVPSGQVLATFDAAGQLCVDASLLDHAGITAPLRLPESTQCVRVIDGLAGAQVRLDPGQRQVGLLVPTSMLSERTPVPRSWATGGTAGLFNYDALMVSGAGQGQSSLYRNLRTELGFNAGDWVVRSRQNYTSFQGKTRFETLYTQASRTWEHYQANVQLGQLGISSPLFAAEPFTGFQLLPETALALRNSEGPGLGTAVEGLAYSPSRVEVRQNGVVIYTTLVPGGPFTLRDLPLLSNQLDLEVTVVEEGGAQRHFRVPAANVRPASVKGQPGYGVAVGKIRRFNNDDRDTPSFFAASKDWSLGPGTQFTAGLMGANDYRSFGWGVQQALIRSSVLSVQQLNSHAPLTGQGHEWQAALNTTLGSTLSTILTATQRSQGFRTLGDAAPKPLDNDPYGRAERQWGASLSHADPHWGAFTGSFSRYFIGNGQDRSRLSASWSRVFASANISLGVQREIAGAAHNNRGTDVYATLALPLGRNRSLSLFGRQDDRRGVRTGARYNEQLGDALGYSLATVRSGEGETVINGRLSAVPRYTSVDLGYSRNSFGTSSYDLSLRGGVAVHEDGLTSSPYQLRDTFGLLKAGNEAGVKVRTPQGPVWTDNAGQAVVASLPAYQTSRVEIDTASLPPNVDVLNGYQELEVGRGAVSRLNFTLSKARRLMLRVRTVEGSFVPKGVSVFDSQGQYLTSVVDAGQVYLADAPEQLALQMTLPDDRRCLLELDSTRLPITTALYESIEATCRAG